MVFISYSSAGAWKWVDTSYKWRSYCWDRSSNDVYRNSAARSAKSRSKLKLASGAVKADHRPHKISTIRRRLPLWEDTEQSVLRRRRWKWTSVGFEVSNFICLVWGGSCLRLTRPVCLCEMKPQNWNVHVVVTLKYKIHCILLQLTFVVINMSNKSKTRRRSGHFPNHTSSQKSAS